MFETAIAQLRFAYSFSTGRPFNQASLERLLQAALATRREFGPIGGDAREFLTGPMLDDETIHDVQLRRLRTQLHRALTETSYYPKALAGLVLDPRRLTWEQWTNLPLTPKEALREQPGAFVRRSQSVTWLLTTTGTTGVPMIIMASTHEMAIAELTTAIGLLVQGDIGEDDIFQITTSARAVGPNTLTTNAARRLGALVYQTGLIDPAQVLAMLARQHDMPGRRTRACIMLTYPSYLGHLIEKGKQLGYTRDDFGLRQIFTGGEIVTAGAKRRAQDFFGPVTFSEGFGISEAWTLNGTNCEQGHLHFDPSRGLVEVLDPETGQPAAAGDVGTLVLTPFAPYFESAVRLRYDTQDMVRRLAEPPTCLLRNLPATSNILGKKALAVHHRAGWTTPRDVLEAIEGIDELPLPARCGFWAESYETGGHGREDNGRSAAAKVAVEVLAPESLRATISRALEAQGIPLGTLTLVDSLRGLQQPYPWRGDLYENSMGEWVQTQVA